MSERILVAVAWPYANGSLHLGHIAGAYLPADVFARYHRLKGNEVLMVSGSDQHGTPITVRADQEGRPPKEIADRYHQDFLRSWQQLGISFDLFTTTDTPNHHAVAQDIFLKLREKGHIYQDTTQLLYCPTCTRFLPDRYVEGTCPFCSFQGTRGDQCDKCGKPLNPVELIDPYCRICSSVPEVRESEHFFLRLSAFNDQLLEWVRRQSHWRQNVLNFTIAFLNEGLKDRAITRDIEWGIPVPVPGFESKRIYVWFEAVIGYLSASMEWAQRSGNAEKWRDFWQRDCKSYYFIGKDNIPFHAIFWPAQLLGARGLYADDPQQHLILPYDVPANEFMNMEGQKISGSRKWYVPMLEALQRYDPDPLRYYLTAVMPETRDSDWSWQGFVERNNSELVSNWGNLVNRVLNMIQRYFQGVAPEPGPLTPTDSALLAAINAGFDAVGGYYDGCKFRAAAQELLRLSTLVNQYLEETSPWKTAKSDRTATGRALHTALQAINALKVMWAPILPFTSQALHEMLGETGTLFGAQKVKTYQESTRSHVALTYAGETAVGAWTRVEIPTGRQLPKPKPLFKQLDESIVETELSRLTRSEVGRQ